jgi:opacity protein-like surface antigen
VLTKRNDRICQDALFSRLEKYLSCFDLLILNSRRNAMMNKLKLTALYTVLVGTMSTNIAHAAESGFYIGLDAGRAEIRKACDDITNCDNADTSVRGELGYQFNGFLGGELGYTSFGTIFDASDNLVSAKQDANALTASIIATIPPTGPFGIFGRIGVARYDVNNSGTIQGLPVESENSTKPYYGMGARFDLSSNFALRAEYQRYQDISGVNGNKDDIQGWYGGGVFTF